MIGAKGRIDYRYSPCAHGRCYGNTRLADSMSDVTCGLCRRKIATLGLKPIENYSLMPLFDVVSETRFDSGCGWHVVFRCPVCGRVNTHGRPGHVVGGGDGHRVSHCRCWPAGYYVREVPREDN